MIPPEQWSKDFVDAQAPQPLPDGSYIYRCGYDGLYRCQCSFVSLHDLDQHQFDTHCVSAQKTHPCDRCVCRFHSHDELNAHKRSKHAPVYACGACNRRFKTAVGLESHSKAKKHPKRTPDQILGPNIVAARPANAQSTTPTIPNAVKYDCEPCQRTFKTPAALNDHVKSHRKCTLCTHTCRSRSALKRHMAVEHQTKSPSTPSLNIPCPVCGTMFSSQILLMSHRLSAHSRSHPCKTCDERSQCPEVLQLHTEAKNPAKGLVSTDDSNSSRTTVQHRCGCSICHRSLAQEVPADGSNLTGPTVVGHTCNCAICDRKRQSLQAPAQETVAQDLDNLNDSIYESDIHSPSSERSLPEHSSASDGSDTSSDKNLPRTPDKQEQVSYMVSCYDSSDEESSSYDGTAYLSPEVPHTDLDEDPDSVKILQEQEHVTDQSTHEFDDKNHGKLEIVHPTCTKCDLPFEDMVLYDKHCLDLHEETYCRTCRWQFDSRETLSQHFRHFAIHPLCEACDIGFVDDLVYRWHLVHHEEADSLITKEETHEYAKPDIREVSETREVAVVTELLPAYNGYCVRFESPVDDMSDSRTEISHASVSSHELDPAMLERLDRRLESSCLSLDKEELHDSEIDAGLTIHAESLSYFQHSLCLQSVDSPQSDRTPSLQISASIQSSGILPPIDSSFDAKVEFRQDIAVLDISLELPVENQHREDDHDGMCSRDIQVDLDYKPRCDIRTDNQRSPSVTSSDHLSDEFDDLSSSTSSLESSMVLVSKESLPQHIQDGRAYLVATSSRSPISASGSLLLSSTPSPASSMISFYEHGGCQERLGDRRCIEKK